MTTWQQQRAQAAAAYGTNPDLLAAVNQREQGGRPGFVVNTWDSNAAAGHPSGGPFQFIEPTFNAYAKQARAANPAAWRGVPVQWRNPYAQALAASWAFANGKGSAWSTYDKALADAGGRAQGPRDTRPAPSSGAGGGEAGGQGGSGRFTPQQRAAMQMVFGDNRRMWRLLEQVDAAASATGSAEVEVAPVVGRAGRGGASVAAQIRDAGGKTYEKILRLGQREFGLRIDGASQTTGGAHEPGSFHYSGRAVDFGDAKNSREKLVRFAAWARQNSPYIKEFYYNPLGWGIRNGRVIKGLTVPGHDDHVHISI